MARFSVAIWCRTTSQNSGILTEVECFVTDFFRSSEKRNCSKSGKSRTVGWRDRARAARGGRFGGSVAPASRRLSGGRPRPPLSRRPAVGRSQNADETVSISPASEEAGEGIRFLDVLE